MLILGVSLLAINSSDEWIVYATPPCLPGCPQLSFSHLPALGENGTVTLTVGSDGYFLYNNPLENSTKNLLVAFYSNPANAVEFPELELVRVPTEKPWQDPDGDGIREVMTMPFAMSPNQNAVFSTTFKITQLGEVDFSAQIIDSENTRFAGTGKSIFVYEDGSALSPHYELLEAFALNVTWPPPHAESPPPLRQIRDGTNPDDIRCNQGKVHVVRNNGNHACVKETTADKMNWKVISVQIETGNRLQTLRECTGAGDCGLVIAKTSTGNSFNIMDKIGHKDTIRITQNIPQRLPEISSEPCVPGCPELSFSYLPKSNTEGMVTLTFGSDAYIDYDEYVDGDVAKTLLVAFYSKPADVAEFPDIGLVKLYPERQRENSDGDGTREVFAVSLTVGPHQNATFSTPFKIIRSTPAYLAVAVIDPENNHFYGDSTPMWIGGDFYFP